jgi:hypothetical protein
MNRQALDKGSFEGLDFGRPQRFKSNEVSIVEQKEFHYLSPIVEI